MFGVTANAEGSGEEDHCLVWKTSEIENGQRGERKRNLINISLAGHNLLRKKTKSTVLGKGEKGRTIKETRGR